MYVFNVIATNKSKEWVQQHKINLSAVSAALSILVSEVHPSVKIHPVKLTLQIRFNKDDSEYRFNTNKIRLCETPYNRNDNQTKKHQEIFDHFLHEFRHWMQSKIYKIGTRELKYTEEDVLYNTNAYYRNKLEIDARQFVRQYLKKFIKYYTVFTKVCQ